MTQGFDRPSEVHFFVSEDGATVHPHPDGDVEDQLPTTRTQEMIRVSSTVEIESVRSAMESAMNEVLRQPPSDQSTPRQSSELATYNTPYLGLTPTQASEQDEDIPRLDSRWAEIITQFRNRMTTRRRVNRQATVIELPPPPSDSPPAYIEPPPFYPDPDIIQGELGEDRAFWDRVDANISQMGMSTSRSSQATLVPLNPTPFDPNAIKSPVPQEYLEFIANEEHEDLPCFRLAASASYFVNSEWVVECVGR
jgi:hypothetical protein